MRKLALSLTCAAVWAVPSLTHAQTSASANLTVEATVIQALTLSKLTAGNLSFGSLAQGTTKSVAATSASAIKFQADGEPSQTISVSFADVSMANGAATMTYTPTVNAFATDVQASSAATSSGSTVTLDASTGDYFFWVGGSVTAGASQATGSYSGTFTLTVAYTGV